jgi:hypothetical protein
VPQLTSRVAHENPVFGDIKYAKLQSPETSTALSLTEIQAKISLKRMHAFTCAIIAVLVAMLIGQLCATRVTLE